MFLTGRPSIRIVPEGVLGSIEAFTCSHHDLMAGPLAHTYRGISLSPILEASTSMDAVTNWMALLFRASRFGPGIKVE
jgi:hypothetical protein